MQGRLFQQRNTTDFTNYIIIFLPVSCQLAEHAIFSHQRPITRLAGHSLPASRVYGLIYVLQSKSFLSIAKLLRENCSVPRRVAKKHVFSFFLLSQNVYRTTIIQDSEVGNERRYSCATTPALTNVFLALTATISVYEEV